MLARKGHTLAQQTKQFNAKFNCSIIHPFSETCVKSPIPTLIPELSIFYSKDLYYWEELFAGVFTARALSWWGSEH